MKSKCENTYKAPNTVVHSTSDPQYKFTHYRMKNTKQLSFLDGDARKG